MEQSFAERLKKYRREKNLTQQELADRLGVSNKTVSRWESDGGYPDVPLLVPLARALGVTADDLLDGERPIRTLTAADGQNLLSFAFALGGGVLFYLLGLFMPTAVCYLGYLGCLAYGVYLQKYYCYRTRWFRLASLAMNFFVNLSLAGTFCAWAAALLMGTGEMSFELVRLMASGGSGSAVASVCALAAALTAVTAWGVERFGFGKKLAGRARLPAVRLRRPTLRNLVPAFGVVLIAVFWTLFRPQMGVPLEFYLNQKWLYGGLLLVLTLLCVVLYCKKGHRFGLVPSAVMALGGLCLPLLATEYAWLANSGRFILTTPNLAEYYPRFGCVSDPLLCAAAVLMLICIALVVLRVEREDAE